MKIGYRKWLKDLVLHLSINMSQQYYAITIKYIRQGAFMSEAELLAKFASIVDRYKGMPKKYTFEQDSMGRNHLHGLFTARKGIRLNLCKTPYYHIHIDPLKTLIDVETWLNYIDKDQNGFNQFIDQLHNGTNLFQ